MLAHRALIWHTARMRQRRSVHIRIDQALDDWLTEEARRRMVSKTLLVERALEELRDSQEVRAA